MKHAQTIIIAMLAALLLAACGRHRYPPALLRADSMAAKRPDSARLLLGKMAKDTASWAEDARMFYRLLCLETADRLYKTPNSDSAVRPLLNHYEHDGDHRLLPRAYYAAGRVYSEMNDAPQAAKYYKCAIKAARGKHNALIKSRAYSQLGYLFAESGLNDNALKMFKLSYAITSQIGDTISIVYDLRDIARTYADKNLCDSALATYKIALNMATSKKLLKMAASVNTQIAALFEKEGKCKLAWKHLLPAMEYSNPTEENTRLSIAARLYAKENKVDSAAAYYEKLAEAGNVFGKYAAHTWLAEHYTTIGDHTLAARHLMLSKQFADSVNKRRAATAVNVEVALFDNDSLKKENKLQYGIIVAMIVGILCLIAALAKAITIIKRKRTKVFKAPDDTKPEMHDEYRVTSAPNGECTPPRIETAAEQTQKLATEMTESNALTDSEHRERIIKGSNIYVRICKKLDNPNASAELTYEEWEELSNIVNIAYTDFRKRLYELCDMSIADYRICLLIKIGLKLREIASLVHLSYQGLASARSKLYLRAYGIKGEAKAWDKVVKEL